MFQLEKRVNSLTYSQKPQTGLSIDEINEKLSIIQTKSGAEFDSIKHAFEWLLDTTIEFLSETKPKAIETNEDVEEKTQESTEKSDNHSCDNQVIKEFIESNPEIAQEFTERLKAFAIEHNTGDQIKTLEILNLALIDREEMKESYNLMKEKLEEVNVEEESPTIPENSILILLSDRPEQKKLLIEQIFQNRKKKGYSESFDEFKEKMLLNDNTLKNQGGSFYTGFNAFSKIK